MGGGAEYNQERRRKYHHVISIDASPCVENHTMFLVVSPEELILQDENEAAAKLELAAAIAQLSPVQSRRLRARYALNKKFREIAADEGISGSCAVKTVTAAVTKLQKEIKARITRIYNWSKKPLPMPPLVRAF